MDISPIVIKLGYHSETSIEQQVENLTTDISEHALSPEDKDYLIDYPTVYIIYGEEKSSHSSRTEMYIGETNSIARRTLEHYNDGNAFRREQTRAAWEKLNNSSNAQMYVIAQAHFNKSLTLDIENIFLGYALANGDSHLTLINSRGNPQEEYFTKDELQSIVSRAWEKLHRDNARLFLDERWILNQAVFKASPFHKLGESQLEAEREILRVIDDCFQNQTKTKVSNLIIVEGAAGTGKTVLISHLFLQLSTFEVAAEGAGDETRLLETALIVNHDEQLNVYNSIATRLGLQGRSGQVVFKPTEFINKHSDREHFSKMRDRQLHPENPIDVALVDEAHLLLTQGNQGYSGLRNQLADIMRRARVVIAVYDPNQVLRHSQEISKENAAVLFPSGRFPKSAHRSKHRAAKIAGVSCEITNLKLDEQFRIDASDEVVQWIDDFASGKGIAPIPSDNILEPDHKKYEIKIYDSPFDLQDAIEEKSSDTSEGLSRIIATYDWEYVKKRKPVDGVWEVRIEKDGNEWCALDNSKPAPSAATLEAESIEYFSIPWNYQLDNDNSYADRDKSWAEKDYTIHEAGSIYTIQGFDLNYAGVIIGPSVKYRDGEIVFDPDSSYNGNAINGSDHPEENLKHELNVLLKRGVHGLYLFAVDTQLRNKLLDAAS